MTLKPCDSDSYCPASRLTPEQNGCQGSCFILCCLPTRPSFRCRIFLHPIVPTWPSIFALTCSCRRVRYVVSLFLVRVIPSFPCFTADICPPDIVAVLSIKRYKRCAVFSSSSHYPPFSAAGSAVPFSTMSSPPLSYLSKAGEDLIRQLFKTIRATRYEDPVDQDSFLTASANTVVMSFAT